MSSTIPYNEAVLLQQLAEGSEKAFRQIYDNYHKRIFSFAFLMTESKELSEDVLQEIFTKLWLKKETLAEVKNFNAWVHIVTRNYVVDAMKKLAREIVTKKELGLVISIEDNRADELFFAKENRELLKKAIENLPPQQQLVYKLSHQEGLKNEEIATRLNLSIGTVKVHLHLARKSVRDYFRLHHNFMAIAGIFLALLH